MDERTWEINNLRYGTVKKKADLLIGTGLTPNKLSHGVKKFWEPIPRSGLDAEQYALDLFDFLMDSDSDYYGEFNEKALIRDLSAYINHEVWLVKQKTASIQDDKCSIAMDLRKSLKDHATNMAQIAGRVVKNIAEGLPAPTKHELRELIIDSADEVAELNFGEPLKRIELLKPWDEPGTNAEELKQITHKQDVADNHMEAS